MSTYSKSFPRNKHNFYSEEMVPPLEDEEDPLGDKPARMVSILWHYLFNI